MALDFPSSPTNGQTFTSGSRTWTYNTTTSSWESTSPATSPQTANYVYAAPNGATGLPTFRAIVAADIPTLNQNTTGTAATITGVYSGTITSSQVTTGLGFTPYNATNPSGYTSNLGTVTSVGGTGTVSGLTLSGTVTGSGNLTLGGTLSVTASNFASQTANTFLSAPNGAAGTPTFRAIVAADIPTLNQNTSGSAGSLSDFSNYMVNRGTVAQANVDTAILNGFYTQTNALDSQALLVFNAGGSLGPLQMTFTYGGLMQFRNKTDSANFTAWKTVVTGVSGTAPIVSSGGATPAISISAATTSAAGSMSAADKTKLDGIAASANNYVLPKATASALGGVEVFDATVQTVAANAVTTTASRTYGVQLNAADQMVVNVPWSDTTGDATKLPLSGGTLTGVLTVPANATTSGGGINFSGTGSTFIRGTSGDGASSTTSNLQLQSWFGIGFGPSISGQTVPIGENAAWLDCRSGSFSARADFRAPIFYDSNNTSYYSDPSSTSRFSNFLLGGNEVYVYEGTTNVLNIRTGASPNHKYFGFGTDGRFTASNGGITSTSDARATIFYDVDNTAYYMNPLGTTNLLGNLYIARDGTSNDVFGGLEVREYSYAGAATGAATEAPGINFHWSNRGAARIYMNGAGNFVFAGQSDITNNRRDIIFASGYAATRVDAPIFRDSDDTARFFNGTGGINFLTGSSNRVTVYSDDSGLYVNNAEGAGGLLRLGAAYNLTGIYVNPSLYLQSENTIFFRTQNVQRMSIDSSGILTVSGSARAPIFYDTDNTGFYVNPAGDTNLNKTFTYLGGKDVNTNWNTGFQNTPAQSYNFHGDVSSGGPAGTWWFYESMRHSNASNYWGTQIAWGWEDNANRLQQRNVTNGSFGGWVEYLNTSDRTYNGNLYMTGSIRSTSSDMRAPVFYDQDNTGYYINAAGTSYINALNIGPTANGASYLNINGYNAYGGTGFHGFLTIYNTYASATNPQQFWRLNGAGGFEIVNSPYNAVLFTFTQGGDFTAAGNVTAYSDRKLKDNFEPISDAIQKVMQLNGVTFTRIDKEDTTTRYAGLIAQDVEPVLPEAVQKNDTMSYGEVLSVDYNGTIALLVEAIKEQQFQIIELKKELNKLLGE